MTISIGSVNITATAGTATPESLTARPMPMATNHAATAGRRVAVPVTLFAEHRWSSTLGTQRHHNIHEQGKGNESPDKTATNNHQVGLDLARHDVIQLPIEWLLQESTQVGWS